MAIKRNNFNEFTVTHGGTPNVATKVTLASSTANVWLTAKGGDTRYRTKGQDGQDMGSNYAVIPDGESRLLDVSDRREFGTPPVIRLGCSAAAGTTHIDPNRRRRGRR